MQVILPVVLILEDICAVMCMTALIRFIWMYPERSRKCTIIISVAAFALSVSVAVIAAVNIPDVIFSSADDVLTENLSQEYSVYQNYEMICDFVGYCILLFVPLIILRVRHFFKALIIEITVSLIAESVFSFVSYLLKLDTDNPAKWVVASMTDIIVFAVLTVLLLVFMKKERQIPLYAVIDTMPRWLFAVAIAFALATYFKESLFDSGVDYEIISHVYNVFWGLSTIGIMISAVYFVYKVFAMTYQQNQILKQMNDQQVHYEKVLQTDEQLRQFRHDYKNHMMVVTALLNSGRPAEAADYLEKVKVTSGAYGRQFNTGSFIADAILNNKNSLAEEFAIHIGFNGRIPPEGIENSDLCTVFSNLLDNAIEGTKRYSGNRYINIESNVRNGMLALSIVNPVNEPVKIKNNRIKTSKSDSRNHGIGLRNVERTAEKYTGHLLLSCDEKEFCADVSLKLNHSEEKEN